jgi:hypothetical protein
LARFLTFFIQFAIAFGNLTMASSLNAADAANASGATAWIVSNGDPDGELYVPREIQATYDKATRSRDGRPGPNYWQNHSVHTMRINVSPPSKRIEGDQEIVYTNNSPDVLDQIIFRLYLNSHQPEAMRDRSYKPEFLTRGIEITEFSIENPVYPLDACAGLCH